ncbi:MAG: hypothetical protein M3M89_04205, partial [Thermoproteota archaeon]|nr:hypothetical protein [Thermoproteota archaeon]
YVYVNLRDTQTETDRRTHARTNKHITDDEDYEILRHPHCIVIIRNFFLLLRYAGAACRYNNLYLDRSSIKLTSSRGPHL